MTEPARLDLREMRDYARVAALMNEVWSPPSWLYSEGLLEEYLARTGFCLPIGAEIGAQLVGFIGGMPFHGVHCETPIQGIFTSFFTSHPKASVYGVSARLLSTLAERARQHAIDWYLTLLEVHPSTQPLIEALHRRAGLAIAEVLRVEFWVGGPRFLQIDAVPTLQLARFRSGDAAECRALLLENIPRDGIASLPDEATLTAMFGTSEPAWLWRENGRLLAAIVLRRRSVRAAVARTNLHGDWLLFARGLPLERKVAFLRAALASAGLADVAMVVLPRVGACDVELLREMRFLQGPRSMALYAAHVNDKKRSLAPVQKALIEVF